MNPRGGRAAVIYPPGEALRWTHRVRGGMTSVGVGRHGYVLLLGPEANRFVFEHSDAFSWRQTYQMLMAVDGPTALLLSDGEDHRRRRSVVAPFFGHRRVADFVPVVTAHADAVIAEWRPGEVLDIYQHCRLAIRRSVAEALFGTRIGRHADELGDLLQELLDFSHTPPPLVALHRHLGSARWRRATAARRRIDTIVDSEIGGARQAPGSADDLWGTLTAERPPGGGLSDVEIRDQVVSLIAAGYETTSGALAWAIHSLLTVPGAWAKAAREVRQVLDGRAPTFQQLSELTYLTGVVNETLRLYPSAVVAARKVTRDVVFEGRTIRAGKVIVFSPYVTHRLEQQWPCATQFLPERWTPGHPLYRKPTVHTFVPFSGGLHRCIGSGVATLEMSVILARLVASTRLTALGPRPRARNLAALRPWPHLRVRVDAVGSHSGA